jgi:hypothetical protein
MLGLGSGGRSVIAPSGSIQITPNTRLNALLVQANSVDLDMIEDLVKILDMKESPEDVLALPKARVIPVHNILAEEAAAIVKEAFRDRISASGAEGGNRGGQPSPEDIMRMLRGGGRGGSRDQAEEAEKMTVSVDARNNFLVVTASESLFQDVKDLVEEIDQAAIRSDQDTQVITLGKTSPDAVAQALSALMGDSVQFGRSGGSTSTSRPSTSSSRPGAGGSSGDPAADARRQAFMQMMQHRMQGGGGPGGFGGGNFGGRGGRGGRGG